MRSSNSVQIAKIIAVTVVVSSVIIGCFILASTYLAARASCDQLLQLDSVLEKELMLESRHMQPEALIQEEPLPQAEQLQAESSKNNVNEQKLQSLAGDTMNEEEPHHNDEQQSQDESESSSSDDSYSPDSESSEEDEGTPIQFKLPLQLDFDELAGALMEKNQRSRMNCVVEKRKAEEVVDQQPRNLRLPFGLNITTDPKYQRVTGERMAIFCESGHETRTPDSAMHQPQPPMMLPIHLTAPQPQPPQPAQHMQAPVSPATRFFPMPMQPGPMNMPPPEVRVHVQRIAIPTEALRAAMHPQVTQVQQLPLAIGLARAGISAEDFNAIKEAAEARFQREQEIQQMQQQEENSQPEMPRQAFGRSMQLQPVRIPIPMMQQVVAEEPQPERPHYVQPRSVRSVDDTFLHHREKRVKRCACDCSC